MPENVQMPALGESVTEGTVTRWLKSVGDTVAVDEPLLEVSTDKVDTEIPSPVAGVLEKILVAEDDTAEVGADLALIGDGSGSGGGGDAAPPAAAPAAEEDAEPEPEAAEEPSAPAEAPSTETEKPAEKPRAGTGSGGAGASGTSVTLPAMGESVTEGTVTRWLKQVGDTVAVDEPLLEVSTDKVDTEVPSPVAGTLLKIKANEDDTVEVGAVLGVIGEEGESAGDASETAEPEAQPADEGEAEKKAEQEEEIAEETGELPEGDETPESEKDDAPAESEPAAEQASSGGSSSGGGGGGGGTPV